MISGIYQIKNSLTNDIYIGSSKRLNKRLIHHKTNLKCNKHYNKHLQNSFNKYGIENFVFESLITCPPEYCIKLEQWFIDNLKPKFNKALIATTSITLNNHKKSKEKCSINKVGRPKRKDINYKVIQLTKNNEFIKEWENIKIASEYIGIGIKVILNNCLGNTNYVRSPESIWKFSNIL